MQPAARWFGERSVLMGCEHDPSNQILGYYLVPTYNREQGELVIQARCLTAEESELVLGGAQWTGEFPAGGSDWKPIAATLDMAIILERHGEGQRASYRLKTVAEHTLLDVFFFEDRKAAFAAFVDSVRCYEGTHKLEVAVLATQQIESILAL
jgi:hypothetical protein